MKIKLIMPLVLLLFFSAPADSAEKPDLWQHFRFFVGQWEGKGEGMGGISTGQLEFKFIFNEKFLQMQNKSVFEPQEKNPKGEIHEDIGFFSFDKMRNKIVLRQFHIEGFINRYVLESVSADGKDFTFASEQIENGPPDLKARLIYKITGKNEFRMRFDLAFPGKDFQCYSEGVLKRKK